MSTPQQLKESWSDASSVIAGIKMLLGADPKKDYRDKAADVPLP